MSSSRRRFTLIVKCRDTKGIVAAVSGYLAQNDAPAYGGIRMNAWPAPSTPG